MLIYFGAVVTTLLVATELHIILKLELANTQVSHLWRTNSRNNKKETAVKNHILTCDHVFFDKFKADASCNTDFHLIIKESLLISQNQHILNKDEACLPLYLFN